MKLHTHGVNEPNQDVLLGRPMAELHEALRGEADRDKTFRFHYVTARELTNVVIASGADPMGMDFDHRYVPGSAD